MTCLVGATTAMICFVGDAAIYKCGVVYIAYNFDFSSSLLMLLLFLLMMM